MAGAVHKRDDPDGPETPVSWDEADRLAGRRLDRRRRHMIIRGQVCELAVETVACSGCSCDCGDGYPCYHGAAGCHECGYTGKRRWAIWVPITSAEAWRAA